MPSNLDPAAIQTDNIIAEIERRIRVEYTQAEREIKEKLDDYLRRYRIKDATWRRWVTEGKKTQREYLQWRTGQIAIGKRWEEMRRTIATDLQNSSKIAKSIARGYMPDVYALNHDYATFQVETGSLIDTSYTLYSRETAERILRENPKMLPDPGKALSKDIAEGKAIRWNEGKIQSAMLQSLLQGESIPDIATRLTQTVGDSGRAAAIRNARTMATAAQNAGRYDGFRRAEEMGIKLKIEWIAVMDMRTRHSHRQLDGVRVKVGQPFELDDKGMGHVSILYPGQLEENETTSYPQSMIWNCRCTMRGVVDGWTSEAKKHRSEKDLDGMSYDEWKESRKEKPKPIKRPDKRRAAAKAKYIREYESM